MALQTFTFCTQVQGGAGSYSNESNARRVQFGNGYEQVGTGGYRTNRRTYSMTYTGKNYNEVLGFLYNHIITPFFWKTPQGDTAVFRVGQDSISVSPISSGVQTITMEFVEVFTSAS
jgi:phage-related protein